MGGILNLIWKILGRHKDSSNKLSRTQAPLVSETSNQVPVAMNIGWESLVNCIIDEGYTLDHFDLNDLRIVAGQKVLTIIYDRQELGLHSFGIYDYCTTSDNEGHGLMAQIIRENEEDAYKSLLIESSNDEVWINIADCTNRGAGIYYKLYKQMIEVFEPIIIKFIKNNAIHNNVGFCLALGNSGTSLVAPFICQKLKEYGLNFHIAVIESEWDARFKNKLYDGFNQLAELSCTYKIFQYPEVDGIFDSCCTDEHSRNILSRVITYLKSVISG